MKFILVVLCLVLISVPYIRGQEEEIIDEEEEEIFPEGEDDPDWVPPEEEEEEKKPEPPSDPCIGVECGYGKFCVANDDGEGVCKCIQNCRHKSGYGPRFQICSNQNETFPNICDMEREKCMCDSGEEGCKDSKHKNVELKYYGHCRGALACPEELLSDFGQRIRLWLRNVLVGLAGMRELSRSEIMMAREAGQEERAMITPVLWKFCDLDKDPSDGQISQRELLPLIAQLYPLEDCSETFFKNCDGDSNKDISLDEFGSCFGLEKEEIKNRCSEIEVDEEAGEGPEPGFLREE